MPVEQTRRRITASDVARSLGISRATVGFVLNNTPGQTISEKTRMRVIEEANRLGYRPHEAARALASGRNRIILLVLPEWPLDFNLRRNIEEASLALDEAGYTLITYTHHPTGQARPLWEVLQPDVVMSMTTFSPDQAASIRAAGIANLIPDPDGNGIGEYREEGPQIQVEHLHELGHRRIVFAGSSDPRVADLVSSRREVAEAAAISLGLGPLAAFDVDYSDPGLSELVKGWHSSGITAVAAYNDDIGASIVGAALRGGLSVPGDLAVIGHDDTPLASMLEPQLSSVRVDIAGLGRFLAALAIGASSGTKPPAPGPAYRTELVERRSTAARQK